MGQGPDPDQAANDATQVTNYMKQYNTQQNPAAVAPTSNVLGSMVNGQSLAQNGGSGYLNAQQQLLGQLQQQSVGAGNNMAMNQFKAANNQNIQQQAALAAGQMGNQNPGVQANLLQRAAAAQNQGAALSSAQLAGQQQLAAQQGLGMLSAQGVNQAAQQAGLNQQANLANQQEQDQVQEFNQANNSQNIQNQNANTLAGNAQFNQLYGNYALGDAGFQQTNTNNATSGAVSAGGAALGALAQYGAAASTAAAAAAHGRVVQPAPGGKMVKVAEAGQPEAIVPLKSDGTPDKQQASGPGMKQLMSKIDTKKNSDGDIKDLMTKLLAALAAHKKSK